MEFELTNDGAIIVNTIKHDELQDLIKDYLQDCCAICFAVVLHPHRICQDCLDVELTKRRDRA